MSEKRTLKRRHLFYYLRVFDSKNDSLVGHVIDITAEGIKLFGERPIELGKEFKFKMALPEFIKENVEIEFEGVCSWSKRDVNQDFYVAGFKLDKLPEKEIKHINQLVMEAGFQD